MEFSTQGKRTIHVYIPTGSANGSDNSDVDCDHHQADENKKMFTHEAVKKNQYYNELVQNKTENFSNVSQLNYSGDKMKKNDYEMLSNEKTERTHSINFPFGICNHMDSFCLQLYPNTLTHYDVLQMVKSRLQHLKTNGNIVIQYLPYHIHSSGRPLSDRWIISLDDPCSVSEMRRGLLDPVTGTHYSLRPYDMILTDDKKKSEKLREITDEVYKIAMK